MRRVFRIPFSRSRLARDVDDEIAFHLQSRIDALVRSGMNPAEARAAALRQFGDLPSVRDAMLILDQRHEQAQRRGNLLAEFRQDVAFGLRTLRRNAMLTTLVVGGLALGIGANAAIYSLVDAVLVSKLPVPDPDPLVVVGDPRMVDSRGHGTPDGRLFSYPLWADVRKNAQSLQSVAAVGDAERIDARIDESQTELEHPQGRVVSGEYFAVLGVRALLGRTIDVTSDDADAPPQATISYDYWQRRFKGDPGVVGRNIVVDGVRVAIAGVAPAGFTGEVVGLRTDIWLPLALRDRFHPNAPILRDRRMMWLLLIGRPKPGVTPEQVRAQLATVIKSAILATAASDELADIKERGIMTIVAPGARGLSTVREPFTAPLFTLMAGVALLLCIVCVNIANLLLARGIARRREMSLRLAIGANRARIVRQLLVESLVLALLSGLAAVVVAWWGSRLLVTMASEGDPISLSVGPNWRILAFTLGVSVLSVVLFGLMPALRASRVDLASALRSASRSVSSGARFGTTLIAGQVALSLLLLAGASILTRSLRQTELIPLGFDRDHLISADLDISTPGYASERLAAVVHGIRDRVASVPGVAAVSYSYLGIFSGTEWHTDVRVPGFTARTSKDSSTAADNVGAGYVHAIGAHLIAGRDFEAQDEGVAPHTAIVNQSFARFYFSDPSARNVVGQYVNFDDSSIVRVVGVIADVRGRSLDTTESPANERRIYIPYLRRSGTTKVSQPNRLRLLVRASGDPGAIVQAVRAAIAETDRALPIDAVDPVRQLIRLSIRDERLVARLATGLGSLALLLAAIGLFGVASYSIARRTSEFGVRIALGAERSDIAGLAVRYVLRPVLIGVILGVPLSILAVRALEHHLSGISGDPLSILTAIVVLLVSATIAVLVPARRAMLIDPTSALRDE
ncbi:MAG TPA: ABC transporter permease [Gemmatimonadaceae bacterium]